MKLLVVSNYGPTASSRPEAEIYLALARRGYEVAVITHGESDYAARFREAGIRVLFGHPVRRRDERAVGVIRAELTARDYDALVLYNSRAIANGVRAARGLDVTVVAYRGYAGDLRWSDPGNYLKVYHPRVDVVLCNNIGVQQHIRANQWWRRDRTYVVNKGHDLGWYDDVEPLDKRELGVAPDDPLLVCVANAAKFKGVPVLLRAMALVDPTLRCHLVLCGHDMDTPRHRRLAEATAHPERIVFPGFRGDVFRIVRAAHLKVLPSVTGESLTKAVIEAMALGTPALITDIPGNVELVEHGVSGWKVPPGDATALARAIERLVGDAGLRQNLTRGARERLAGPLSHAVTVEAMDEFFRKVIG